MAITKKDRLPVQSQAAAPDQLKTTAAKKQVWRLPLFLLAILIVSAYLLLKGNAPSEVSTATASIRELTGSFTAEAVVKSKEYQLSSEVPGRVAAVLVNEGQSVLPGQLLVRISSTDAEAAVGEAHAAYVTALSALAEVQSRYLSVRDEWQARVRATNARVAEAKANLRRVKSGNRPEEIAQAERRLERARVAKLDAERTYARAKFLFEQGATARANFEAAESRLNSSIAEVGEAEAAATLVKAGPRDEDVAVAQRALESAQADLQLTRATGGQVDASRNAVLTARAAVEQASATSNRARATMDRYELRSPVHGVATKVATEVGAVAGAGLPIITVSTRDDLRVEAEISSEDAGKVRAGMPVFLTSPAYPGQVFKGNVQSVLPVGELKPDAAIRTRIIRTRIALSGDWRLFRPGMELDVEGSAVLKKGLCVPSDAINFTENEVNVLVVSHDRIRRVRVTVGYADADFTEITAGLKSGAEVVVSAPEGLSDGARVKVRR